MERISLVGRTRAKELLSEYLKLQKEKNGT